MRLHPGGDPRAQRGAVGDDQCGLVPDLHDAAYGGVVPLQELEPRLRARHPVGEVALEPGGNAADVAGDRVVVVAHLEVAGLDLLEAGELDQGEAAVVRGRLGGLVGAHPARDVDRVEALGGEGLGGRDRLGPPEVGEVESRVGGVELAGHVGVRLAVAHQQESHDMNLSC